MTVPVIRSRAELEARVAPGAAETIALEFKETVAGWNAKGMPDKDRQRLRREVCCDLSQMANTVGGHIVYGVQEVRTPDGLKVAGAWAPVTDPEGLKAWIDDVLPSYCVPSTFTKEVEIVEIPGGHAVVVTVQPSRHTVYIWDRDARTIQCAVRTSTGKKFLNPDELERHLMDGTRAAKLAFDEVLRAPQRQADVVVADGLWSLTDSESVHPEMGTIRVQPVNDTTFQLTIAIPTARVTVAIPYSLVTHVWLNSQNQMTLMLGARLVFDGYDYQLRPFR